MTAQALRILRISRVVADLDRAERFYCDALGFRTIGRGPVDPTTLAALGAAAAEDVVMRLGAQEMALVRFAVPGAAYPADSRSNDLWFQHLAIVVSDMEAAYAHLSRQPGWQAISLDGPQTLPPVNGGVRAFKFRDPDLHPLELIWFPPGQGRPVWQAHEPAGLFLGIDHSALSVAATGRSRAFYRRLGFTVGARSLNRGGPQSRLDGLPDAYLRVTSLRPEAADSAGLELLRYRPRGRRAGASRVEDAVTDWVTLLVSPSPGAVPRVLRDPDGHRLLLASQGSGAPA